MSEKPGKYTVRIQSEQLLEDELVAQLMAHGYTRAAVTDEASMLANLKEQLEAFNARALKKGTLTDGEFTKVLHHLNKQSGVFNKAHILRTGLAELNLHAISGIFFWSGQRGSRPSCEDGDCD